MLQKPVKARNVIVVRPKPGNRNRALVSVGGEVHQAAIGRSGTSVRKREGDGATPVAVMRLVHGYVRRDRLVPPATALRLHATPKHLLWCDEPRHGLYNRPVGTSAARPFRPSHERMCRDDGLYDICLVMDWNLNARRRYGGSAIFFHLARPGYPPTEGCVAVNLPAMRRMLRLMNSRTMVKIVR